MKIVVVLNYFLHKLGDVSYIELYKLVGTHRPQIDQVASTADDDGEDKRGGDQPEVEVQLRIKSLMILLEGNLVGRVGAAAGRVPKGHSGHLHCQRNQDLEGLGHLNLGITSLPQRGGGVEEEGGWRHHCPNLLLGSINPAAFAGSQLR